MALHFQLIKENAMPLFTGFVKIYPFAKTYNTCSPRSIPLGKSISLYPFYGNRNTHLFSLQIGRNL